MEVQHPGRFAVLVVAALASTWLVLRNPSTDVETPAAPRLGLGYYVRDARLTGSGPDGRILYRVTAAAAEQLLADGTITMQDVAVDYEPAAQVPWKLRASRGQIPPDRNIIELAGDVTALTEVSPAATGSGGRSSAAPLLIRTDYLELDPEAYIARTERMVAVERDRDTLRARGMRVYLKQDRLQFSAEVRGRFLP
ncbi:MAG: LPS export ABC transporter periplasmic protein LptC [Chromatiales bacterium]|nr:LPS export ABC transporter periplasmic protein LptC [Chromatiales bacterium]